MCPLTSLSQTYTSYFIDSCFGLRKTQLIDTSCFAVRCQSKDSVQWTMSHDDFYIQTSNDIRFIADNIKMLAFQHQPDVFSWQDFNSLTLYHLAIYLLAVTHLGHIIIWGIYCCKHTTWIPGQNPPDKIPPDSVGCCPDTITWENIVLISLCERILSISIAHLVLSYWLFLCLTCLVTKAWSRVCCCFWVWAVTLTQAPQNVTYFGLCRYVLVSVRNVHNTERFGHLFGFGLCQFFFLYF